MKNIYGTWMMIFTSLVLGTMASAMVSGCQQSQPPASVEEEPAQPEIEIPATPSETPPAIESAPVEPATTDGDKKPESDSPPAEETKPVPEVKPEPEPKPEPEAKNPNGDAAVSADKPAVKLAAVDKSANAQIKPGDWTQWLGTAFRNNVPEAKNIPTEWDIGAFDRKSGEWQKDDAKNVKWVARLGSQSYGNPVIADGQIYAGTNNGAGYLKRYPYDVDLGCLLCFRESDGQFLWQHSNEKLPTGRVHDWELQGVCATPFVEIETKRLWYITNRGHVVCLDAEGFYDDEDDGPVKNELGRLFDVMRNEDPNADQVGGMVTALNEGKLTDQLRTNFAAAGVELPEDAAVNIGEADKKWTVAAKVGSSEREFPINLVGPKLSAYKVITPDDKDEADVIWSFDMMKELGVSQHNMCSSSITILDDVMFLITGNGVDESHLNIPAPEAPSFVAMDKNTGEVYWTDKSPGINILHGQWSSPTVAVLGGVPQVLFAGGDSWLYSFRADKGTDGKPELLWKFDANPKESKYILGGRGTRNEIIATPVIYDGLVYMAVGQDPEHGEGIGHLWCVDPTKRGDVSPQLAVNVADRTKPISVKRLQAVVPEEGDLAIDNPNSAVVWHFSEFDRDGNGKIDFEETMHRTIGTVAIKDDLLFISDFSGLFHCLDAKTGKPYWVYDMLAAAWGSPLIVDGKVYIGDEDGDIAIFNLSAEEQEPLNEINMDNAVYTTPVVANGVLYIANKSYIFAIQEPSAE